MGCGWLVLATGPEGNDFASSFNKSTVVRSLPDLIAALPQQIRKKGLRPSFEEVQKLCSAAVLSMPPKSNSYPELSRCLRIDLGDVSVHPVDFSRALAVLYHCSSTLAVSDSGVVAVDEFARVLRFGGVCRFADYEARFVLESLVRMNMLYPIGPTGASREACALVPCRAMSRSQHDPGIPESSLSMTVWPVQPIAASVLLHRLCGWLSSPEFVVTDFRLGGADLLDGFLVLFSRAPALVSDQEPASAAADHTPPKEDQPPHQAVEALSAAVLEPHDVDRGAWNVSLSGPLAQAALSVLLAHYEFSKVEVVRADTKIWGAVWLEDLLQVLNNFIPPPIITKTKKWCCATKIEESPPPPVCVDLRAIQARRLTFRGAAQGLPLLGPAEDGSLVVYCESGDHLVKVTDVRAHPELQPWVSHCEYAIGIIRGETCPIVRLPSFTDVDPVLRCIQASKEIVAGADGLWRCRAHHVAPY